MFTFDDKEYDESKLSDKGKVALAQLQHLNNRRNQLSLEYDNMTVLVQHYTGILKEELPKEEVKEKE
jgi:hypothetical protein